MGELKRSKVITAIAIMTAVLICMGTMIAGIMSIKSLTNYFTIKKEGEEFTVTAEIIGDFKTHGTVSPVEQRVQAGEDADVISVEVDGGYTISSVRLYSGAEIDGVYSENDTDGVRWLSRYDRRTGRYKLNTIKAVNANKHVVIVIKEASTVAQIVAVPGDNEELAGIDSLTDGRDVLFHEYETLEDAIADAAEINRQRDILKQEHPDWDLDGAVEIKILVDIDNVEKNQIENSNDVIIDLNGKIVSGSYTDEAIITIINGGSLQVIDRTDGTDDDNIGTISNETGVAILIKPEAELTLGEDDGLTSVSQTCPIIEGGTYGIYKEKENEEEGTFNFYDGKVIGNTAGTVENPSSMGGGIIVDDTPTLYTASDERVMVGDIETAEKTLQRDNEAEAIVNGDIYHQVQKAFAAVNSGMYGNNVEIDLVKDANIDNTDITDGTAPNQLIVNQGKNVVFDLNGNNLIGTVSDYMIKSSGNLEIIDSSTNNEKQVKFTLEKYNENDQYYFVNNRGYIEANNYSNTEPEANEKAYGYVKIDLSKAKSDEEFTLSMLALNTYYTISESAEKPTSDSQYTLNNVANGYSNLHQALNGGKTYYMHLYDKDKKQLSTLRIYQLKLINNATKDKYFALDNAKGQLTYTSAYPVVLVEGTGNVKISNTAFSKTGDYQSFINNSGKLELNKSMADVKIFNYGTEDLKCDKDYIYEVTNGILSNNNTAKNVNAIINNCKLREFSNMCAGTININNSEGSITNYTGNLNAIDTNLVISMGLSYTAETISLKNCHSYGTIRNFNKLLIEDSTHDNASAKRYANMSDSAYYQTGSIRIPEQAEECRITNSNIKNTMIENKAENTYLKNVDCTANYGYIENYSKLTLDGGIYKKAMVYYNSETNIKDGSIIATGTENAITASNYGASSMVNPQMPIINIGTKNTEENKQVSVTTPLISAPKGVGIKGCSINFYDGKISGLKDKAIEGCNILEMEEENENGEKLSIISTIENVSDTYIESLTLGVSQTVVARISKDADININGIRNLEDDNFYNFYTIEDAIAACKDSVNATIQLTSTIKTVAEIIIPQGKDIKLDLNGQEFKSISSSSLIRNNGKLEIVDGSAGTTGEIYAYETPIVNSQNAQLIIGNCKVEVGNVTIILNQGTSDAIRLYAAVLNEGTATINGFATATTMNSYKTYQCVYNKGTLNCEQGTIRLYNAENAQCNVTGANMTLLANSYSVEQAKLAVSAGNVTIENTSTDANAVTVTNGTVNVTNKANTNINIEQTGTNEIALTLINTPTENTVTLTNLKTANIESNSKTTITNCQTISKAIIGKDSTITATSGVESTVTGLLQSEKDGEINISNVKVQESGTISYSGAGTMNIENVNIQTTDIAVQNVGTGTLKISSVGNTIINSSNNIAVKNTSTGTLIIGDKDADVKEYPQISGKTTGVSVAAGSFKYYDGIIKGITQYEQSTEEIPANALVMNGTAEYENGCDVKKEVTRTPSGTKIIYEEKVTLVKEGMAKVNANNVNINASGLSPEDYSTSGDDYVFYTLENAVKACKANVQNGATITILKDCSIIDTIEIAENQNIIIDLNGCEVTTATQNAIINNGTLKIIDSSEEGGKLIIATSQFMNNKGTATIENVSVQSTIVNTNTTKVDMFINEGTLNLKGQYTTENTNARGYDIAYAYMNIVNNKSTGKLNINNLSFNSPVSSVVNYEKINIVENYGDVVINNSLIVFENILNQANGTIEINNSNLDSLYGTITNNSNKVYVEGESKAAITMYNTKINANTDGNRTNSVRTITNTAGEIIIDGANNGSTYHIIVINNLSGKTTLKNMSTIGEIYNNKDENRTGIMYLENITARGKLRNYGTLTIIGGDYKLRDNHDWFDNYGNLTLGKNDGTVEAGPRIEDSYKIGKIKYYDGTIVITSIEAYPTFGGLVEDTPEEYEIHYEDNDGKRIFTLKKETVATIGEGTNLQQFTTLKDALDACTTSNSTQIDLQKNIVISGKEDYEIEGTQNIVLNLNGKKLILNSNKEKVFTVDGKFELTDSQGNASIYSDIDINTPVNQYLILSRGDTTISGGKYKASNIIYAEKQRDKQINITLSGGTFETLTIGYVFRQDYDYIPGQKVVLKVEGNTNTKSDIFITYDTEMEVNGNNVVLGRIIAGYEYAKLKIIKDKYIANLINCSTYTEITGGTVNYIQNGYYMNPSTKNSMQTTTGTISINNNSLIGYIQNNKTISIENSTVAREVMQTANGTINIIDNVIVNPDDAEIVELGDGYKLRNGNVQQNIGIKGGTVKLGIKDLKMKKDSIKIYGKTYGLDAVLTYLYDGTIYGGTKAISSSVNVAEVETFYQREIEDNGKVEYLQLIGTVDDKAEIQTAGTYKTVKLALNAIENTIDKKGTINLVNGNTVIDNTDDVIEISENMDVTINLNGLGIIGLLENSPIIKVCAGAKLTIIGTSAYGIENKLGVAIENEGTLVIGNETDSTVNANTPVIKGETNAITNSGNISMYDGILKAVDNVIDGVAISTYLSGYSLTTGQEAIEGVTYNTLKLTN